MVKLNSLFQTFQSYLVRDIKPPIVFPNFFHQFSSVLAVEKENKLRKIRGKNLGKQIGCLVI